MHLLYSMTAGTASPVRCPSRNCGLDLPHCRDGWPDGQLFSGMVLCSRSVDKMAQGGVTPRRVVKPTNEAEHDHSGPGVGREAPALEQPSPAARPGPLRAQDGLSTTAGRHRRRSYGASVLAGIASGPEFRNSDMTVSTAWPRAVLDVRCLQDPAYAQRGIGRHALALLRTAPAGWLLEGLVDPRLPSLVDEARATLSAVHSNAYAAAVSPPDLFVALSPMTHDPLHAGRLLSNRALRRAAVVYDFIPWRTPERYLGGGAERLSYAVALRWLARCDILAPISQSVAADLVRLLDVEDRALAVTGAAVDARFEQVAVLRSTRAPRHILVVGGGDVRKNPEVVVRAHAHSILAQQRGLPLVIAGDYLGWQAAEFRRLTVACGGRPELLEVPGHVPEPRLLELYALAHLVICPSRDEGFSLPVVEGMAAGLPVLVSDIPAHRELVDDLARRFAPDDDAALTMALERLLQDDHWRRAVVARQEAIWPKFRDHAVGRRFWDAALPRGPSPPAAPAVTRGRLPRVALLSPLPPDRSGVADYTAATCAALGMLVDLHVFTETLRPDPPPNVATVRPLTVLPHLMPRFDRIINVVGNSHYHLRTFELLLRHGGACIAHDARMLSFYVGLLGPDRASRVAACELGRPVAVAELEAWLANESELEALFLGEILEAAAPTIVHSRTTARMATERYPTPPVHVPFSIYRTPPDTAFSPDARRAARRRLGIADGEVAIVSLGFVTDTKAPAECIHAIEMLRHWGIPATLYFAGDRVNLPDGGAALIALATSLGISNAVRFTDGFIAEAAYQDYLIGCDLALQLRTLGFGSVSGAVLDCVAAGLPVVTTAGLAEAVEVPAGLTRAVSDHLSPVLIAEAAVDLLTATRDEEARRTFCEARSMTAYAALLCDALGLSVTRKASPPSSRGRDVHRH